MAITQGRLQQIIQEEVARLLREADEAADLPSEKASKIDQLGARTLKLTTDAEIKDAEADFAEKRAQILQGAVGEAESENYEADALGYGDAAEEATGAATVARQSAEQARQKAAHNKTVMDTINSALASADVEEEEPEGSEEEAPPEEPETVTEGALLERWNKLAFGRKLL